MRIATVREKKGWGFELIFASNSQYAGKILVFEKKGARCSMHFHVRKVETWLIYRGKFRIHYINPENAQLDYVDLDAGDAWHNEYGHPHQIECLSDEGEIFEVSTADYSDDNYRVYPGDSQK
jgi:mannose-6-phosphate isomerase-like protein (cupin superfamily)